MNNRIMVLSAPVAVVIARRFFRRGDHHGDRNPYGMDSEHRPEGE
ncbi:hypothetical protein [Streptomyces minutiscleroticus]|nr:hypothetical protein [Streptomyces minutiscleroticus]